MPDTATETATEFFAPTAAAYAQALLDADVNDDADCTPVYNPHGRHAKDSDRVAEFVADDGEYEYVVTVVRRSSRR